MSNFDEIKEWFSEHDAIYPYCAKERALDLIRMVEKAEAKLEELGKNPDFGSLLDVIKQRNQEIWLLEAKLERVKGLCEREMANDFEVLTTYGFADVILQALKDE